MPTYKLCSSAVISAPGIVKWAINGAKHEKDLPVVVNLISLGWNMPKPVVTALVTEAVPYRIEGEDVVFEVPESHRG